MVINTNRQRPAKFERFRANPEGMELLPPAPIGLEGNPKEVALSGPSSRLGQFHPFGVLFLWPGSAFYNHNTPSGLGEPSRQSITFERDFERFRANPEGMELLQPAPIGLGGNPKEVALSGPSFRLGQFHPFGVLFPWPGSAFYNHYTPSGLGEPSRQSITFERDLV